MVDTAQTMEQPTTQGVFQSFLNRIFSREISEEDRRAYTSQLDELFLKIVQAHFGQFADALAREPEFAYSEEAQGRAKQIVIDNTLELLKTRIISSLSNVVSPLPSHNAAQLVIDYYLTTNIRKRPAFSKFSALITLLKAAFPQNQDEIQKTTVSESVRSITPLPTEVRYLILCIASILQDAAITAPPRYYSSTQVNTDAREALETILKVINAIRVKYLLQTPLDAPLRGLDSASRELNRQIALAEHRVWLPFKPLVMAPLASQEDLKLYARDNKDVEVFANRISRSDGVFLITGYRGVGKSTFIYEALSLLAQKQKYKNEDDQWHVVPISISLAKASGITNILRLCIRKLFETFLNENEEFVDVVSSLTKNVGKLLTDKELNHLTVAHLRATWKVNMQRDDNVKTFKQMGFDAGISIKPGSLLEPTVGNIIAGTVPSFGASGKMSKEWNKAIGSTVALPDYDEDKAEDDIVQFIRMLATPNRKRGNSRIRLVFIFDEMDKMNEDEQEELIKQLKNLFLERHSIFLLVTSKGFYYRWWDERKVEDAILSSYFSWIKTIPLFTSAETAVLLKRLIQADDAASSLSKEEETFVDTIARYLTYRARGIPRDIMRELQSIQLWLEDSTQAYIENRMGQYPAIHIYAELQNCLEGLFDYTNTTGSTQSSDASASSSSSTADNTLIADHIWTNEGRKEQVKRGLYVIMEELLDQGSIELNPDSEVFRQICKDNLKMVLPHEFKLLLDRLALRLRDLRIKIGPDTPLASFYPEYTSNTELAIFSLETSSLTVPGFQTLTVLPQFYSITGRSLNLSSVEVPVKDTLFSLEKIEELLQSDDLQQQRAISALQRTSRPFSQGVNNQLCRLFLTAQNIQTRRSVIGLQDGAFFDAVRHLGAASLNAFIDTETDERLLQEFIRLVRVCTDGSSKREDLDYGTTMLLRLLERQTKAMNALSFSPQLRSLALPESLLVDTISILATIVADDVLPQVMRSLNPDRTIPEVLLVPLKTLESKSRQDLVELLVSLNFNAISSDTLQTLLRGKDNDRLMLLWERVFAQKNKAAAQRVLPVLAQQIMRSSDMSASTNEVVSWINRPVWDDIDQQILSEAQARDPNLLFQLQKAAPIDKKERLIPEVSSPPKLSPDATALKSSSRDTSIIISITTTAIGTVAAILGLAVALHVTFLWWFAIGIAAGILASTLLRGAGYGLLGDTIVGSGGALAAGILTSLLWPAIPWISYILAFIGACIFIVILRVISGGARRF